MGEIGDLGLELACNFDQFPFLFLEILMNFSDRGGEGLRFLVVAARWPFLKGKGQQAEARYSPCAQEPSS